MSKGGQHQRKPNPHELHDSPVVQRTLRLAAAVRIAGGLQALNRREDKLGMVRGTLLKCLDALVK